jgi:hypothetical protein
MSAIHLLAAALRAFLEYAPRLAPKVLFTILGTWLVVWTGGQLYRLVEKLTPGLTSGDTLQPRLDRLLVSYTLGTFYALALMYVLGGVGLFTPWALWPAMLVPAVLAGPRQAFSIPRSLHNSLWRTLPFLILLLGPLLISLTCPVPSWMDVLENNVGPVQRLITFSSFDRLGALPSALYPANRASPLFTAFFGLVAQCFGLDAHEVLAATLVPSLLLTLAAAYRLGEALLPDNRAAGPLAAFSWVLSYNYLHLQSSQSTVWQMTFTLVALARAIELQRNPGDTRLMFECAVASAATILAHPFEAFFTVIAVILLGIVALWRERFRHLPQYLFAAGIAIALSAPLLWTWWPRGWISLAAGIALFCILPTALRFGFRGETVNVVESPLRDSRFLYVGACLVVVSTLLLRWDFYGFGVKVFMLHQLARYPLPTVLTLFLIVIALRTRNQGALLAGSAILAASLPLWFLPSLRLSPVTFASLRYEFPLKGMDFWLSGIMTVCGSVVLCMLWASKRHPVLSRALVVSLLVLPVSVILHLKQDKEHLAAGLIAMTRWQLHLVGEGYWGGWADARYVVSSEDRNFFGELRSLVDQGRIGASDRIDHVAEGSNLKATAFPAFTGVGQNLYLSRVDRSNIHTNGGRLFQLDAGAPPDRWLLVEKPMLHSVSLGGRRIIYENNRVILAERQPAAARPSY